MPYFSRLREFAIILSIAALIGGGCSTKKPLETDQNQPVVFTWEKTYGYGQEDDGWSAAEVADGYVISGTLRINANPTVDRPCLIRVDKQGNEQWTRTYLSTDSLTYGRSVVSLDDGGFLLAADGKLGYYSHSMAHLIQTDQSGTEVWHQTVDLGRVGDYYAGEIIRTDGGSYLLVGTFVDSVTSISHAFVVEVVPSVFQQEFYKSDDIDVSRGTCITARTGGGYAVGGNTGRSGVLIPLDETGAKENWFTIDGGLITVRIASIEEAKNGDIFLGGLSFYGVQPTVSFLKKMDSNGNALANFDVGMSAVNGLVAASDGGVFVSGYSQEIISILVSSAITIGKFDQNGEMIWTQSYEGDGFSFGGHMIATSDGGFLLVGRTWTSGGYSDIYVVKTDSQGLVQ